MAATKHNFGRAGDASSLGHYQNPVYYWRSYARRKHDVAFYLKLARAYDRVLEYGIGNGRVALPLARAGKFVSGIDLSRPMLDDLRARLEREPRRVRERVTAHWGDMRKVRLRQRFPLVIAPFNALLHLYTLAEITAFLERVREHLSPDGQFVFDVSVPDPGDLSRDPGESFRGPAVRDVETGERLSYRESFSYDPLRQILVTTAEFSSQGRRRHFVVPLTQRQFFPAELEALLHYAGFADVVFEPDFGAAPGAGGIDSLVVRCQLKSTGVGA